MKTNIVFFEDAKDLESLTGLSHDELWDKGFDLDDILEMNINKLKLICGLSHCESSKEGKYIFLMQSFFEMTTYLSAIIDIIKLKKVLL